MSPTTQRMTGVNRKEMGAGEVTELVECDRLLVLKCLLTKHRELGPKDGQNCIKDGNGSSTGWADCCQTHSMGRTQDNSGLGEVTLLLVSH